MIEHINWYPGHMKKTKKLIQENLKLVDVVIEVIDARIPNSSRNPIIDELVKNKGSIVLNMNCMSGSGVTQLLSLLTTIQKAKNEGQILKRTLRMMIVGVPNVGKSSLINRLTGKKSTQVGDRPGVTKGKQWLTIQNDMQLLDTPGILWPKFDDPNVGLNLAFCGSIKDEIMDMGDLAFELIKVLQDNYADLLVERYKIVEIGETPLETMEAIALKRGFILSGKRIDYERTARAVLDEFRAGAIGRITLEKV